MTEPYLPADSLEPGIEEYILELEARLNSQRSNYAENAFGIGCRAIVIPVVLVIGVPFLFGARGWVAFFLISTSAILLAFVLVSLFANQAQKNAARRIFHDEIEPALEECRDRYNRSLEEIYATAAEVLPMDAILRTFLPLPILNTEEPPDTSAGES